MLHRDRYLGQIEVCRQLYSVAKGLPVTSKSYDAIDSELGKTSLRLDREFTRLNAEERDS
jgi:TfoX/Sxy family transcriptional regulator of competence genes